MKSVMEANPKTYGQSLHSGQKYKWIIDIKEEPDTLDNNGVGVVVVPPKGSHVLYTE